MRNRLLAVLVLGSLTLFSCTKKDEVLPQKTDTIPFDPTAKIFSYVQEVKTTGKVSNTAVVVTEAYTAK